MEKSNTPALQALGEKVRQEQRVYVSRETRQMNALLTGMENTLTALMQYSVNRKNSEHDRKIASEIFTRMYNFNAYLVEQNTPKNEDSTQQPELQFGELQGGGQ